MTREQLAIIKREFSGLSAPPDFAGGCRKSRLVAEACVHFRPDMSVSKVTENPSCYGQCPRGRKYTFSVG